MNMLALVKKIFPVSFKRFLRSQLNCIIKEIKTPRMIYGYQDYNGEWQSKTRISDSVVMNHPDRISIADNVFIWHYTILDGTGGLEIGEGCQIGAWVGIFTHSSHIALRIYGNHYMEVPEEDKQGYPITSIKIGKYAFIGSGARILPRATKELITIGNGSLITPGSMVMKSVGDFEIVSGNPAKVIGNTKDLDQDFFEDPELFNWYNEWQKR
jgi:acetyltransferase-like isoleucine patch superfamily enzyme